MSSIADSRHINRVLDVKVQVTAQLGTCEIAMKDILELAPGAVLQLRQRAKEPVGLYVNGRLIAFGEVVIVEDNFGIKITEMVEDSRP